MTDQIPELPDSTKGELPSFGTKEVVPSHQSQAQEGASNRGESPVQASASINKDDLTSEWAFLTNQQHYLQDHIRFADQKAAFIFTFSLAALGFLYSQDMYIGLYPHITSWIEQHIIGTICTVFLLMSCVLAVSTVLPRLWSYSGKGIIFWDDFLKYGSAEKYFEEIRSLNPNSIHVEISKHCFILGKICSKKFKLVKYGIWAAVIGSIFAIIWILPHQVKEVVS